MSECPRPASSGDDVMDLISVSGSFGDQPDVEVRAPFHTSETAFEDVVEGEGTPIRTDDQPLVLEVSLISGETGEQLVSTPFDGNTELERVVNLERWAMTFPAFPDALHCATEGSRVAIALAPGDVEALMAEQLGLGDDESAVAVVDVTKVYLNSAAGTLQYNDARGLPTVVRAPDGRPGVIIPDAAPPEDLVVQTLVKGTGPEVQEDDTVRVQYTGLTWDEREVFDSTWDSSSASLTLDQVVPGFAEALRGQTVGSQVQVVIPPDQGYGDQERPGIPAGSTLVFVIDIVGIDQVPAD